ncbi:protein LITTLE ZIPPER 4-like [Punica granatum]|uniref:Uncharacterized protein n=2 Tax=Punica granatum TaxID=22663 RepID=A0A218X2D2_PUNGR|nr:protein LITTLE ZIPPER 4-like [Punica granatum]OWM79094.1 hypothetical protein CDL15_Pgr003265 [Punica granatum]PKI49326.1 hypothetical protein CRG98_030254 [Punica granatum]
MERLNSNLYLANCLIEENARLRKKKQLLDQENKALLSQLKQQHQQHVVNSDPRSTNNVDDLALMMTSMTVTSPSSASCPNTSAGPSS